jgi:hypothetical protein
VNFKLRFIQIPCQFPVLFYWPSYIAITTSILAAMSHYDQAVQTEPPDDPLAVENQVPDMNHVLDNAQKVSGSLGEFLRDLFKVPP